MTAFRLMALATPVLLSACGGAEPEKPMPPPVVSVRVVRVGGDGVSGMEVPGVVEAVRAADIASRVSAAIEAVPVEEGDSVRKGDLLVALDGRDLRARLEAAEAALRAAAAQRDRLRSLALRDSATRQEVEAAEAAFAAARAERDAAGVQIEYVEMRAPFDGWITRREANPGDLAVPGRLLVSLQGKGDLRVAATVSRAQADGLRPGQAIEAVLEGGEVTRARLSVLAPAGDAASMRFLVKADLPPRSGARAGSFARLRVPHVGGEAPVPMVPRTAILERGALSGVLVVEDGIARLRWISPGESAGDMIVVRAGLSAGESVIAAPAGIADGTPVQVTP